MNWLERELDFKNLPKGVGLHPPHTDNCYKFKKLEGLNNKNGIKSKLILNGRPHSHDLVSSCLVASLEWVWVWQDSKVSNLVFFLWLGNTPRELDMRDKYPWLQERKQWQHIGFLQGLLFWNNQYINHKHSVAFMIQDSRKKLRQKERKGRKRESAGLNVFVKKKRSSKKVSPCVHKKER